MSAGLEMPVMGHIVECDTCHKKTVITNGEHIHDALRCGCCPGHSSAHSDAGQSCRTVTVHGNAFVSLVDMNGASN
jgi:hypothetical protein